MSKTLMSAIVLSVAVFGASALPASARLSAADCAYAQKNLNEGVGTTGSNHFNPNAVDVQNCRAQGF